MSARQASSNGTGAGRVAVVTGASSGIGEATARRLDRDGWRVVVVARRADRLDDLAGSLREARPVAVDLTEDDAPARVREEIEQAFDGALHLLVNNAGGSWHADFGDPEKGGTDNLRHTFELNFFAQTRLTEELLPVLRRSAPSSMVNVASVAGRVARRGGGAYSASKAALILWSEALALEEREHGVHVGTVEPGFIRTEGFPQTALVRNPFTRRLVSTPERAADAIVDAGPGGRAERIVPRPYGVITGLRGLAPRVVRAGQKRMGV